MSFSIITTEPHSHRNIYWQLSYILNNVFSNQVITSVRHEFLDTSDRRIPIIASVTYSRTFFFISWNSTGSQAQDRHRVTTKNITHFQIEGYLIIFPHNSPNATPHSLMATLHTAMRTRVLFFKVILSNYFIQVTFSIEFREKNALSLGNTGGQS